MKLCGAEPHKMTTTSLPKFYSEEDAARIIGFDCVASIRRRRGVLCAKRFGRKWRIPEDALRAYLETGDGEYPCRSESKDDPAATMSGQIQPAESTMRTGTTQQDEATAANLLLQETLAKLGAKPRRGG
jgi:helix-turn-helix protein